MPHNKTTARTPAPTHQGYSGPSPLQEGDNFFGGQYTTKSPQKPDDDNVNDRNDESIRSIFRSPTMTHNESPTDRQQRLARLNQMKTDHDEQMLAQMKLQNEANEKHSMKSFLDNTRRKIEEAEKKLKGKIEEAEKNLKDKARRALEKHPLENLEEEEEEQHVYIMAPLCYTKKDSYEGGRRSNREATPSPCRLEASSRRQRQTRNAHTRSDSPRTTGRGRSPPPRSTLRAPAA